MCVIACVCICVCVCAAWEAGAARGLRAPWGRGAPRAPVAVRGASCGAGRASISKPKTMPQTHAPAQQQPCPKCTDRCHSMHSKHQRNTGPTLIETTCATSAPSLSRPPAQHQAQSLSRPPAQHRLRHNREHQRNIGCVIIESTSATMSPS